MEQVTYADAGQQGGAGDDAMEVVGEDGGDPPAKRVQDLQAQIAGLAANISAIGAEITELVKFKRTASDARLVDINNDITDLKAQQTKLEAQQAKLEDQVADSAATSVPRESPSSRDSAPRSHGD